MHLKTIVGSNTFAREGQLVLCDKMAGFGSHKGSLMFQCTLRAQYHRQKGPEQQCNDPCLHGTTRVFECKKLLGCFQTLFTNYAQIDNLAMDDVETNIRKQWDPNTPIESMYKQIQTNCDIAKMANQLYSAAQKLSFAYTLVFKTGMYFEACKEWDAKPAADKTWANFKLHFKEEQTCLDRQQCMTQQGGYHSANAALAAQAAESVAQIIASANAERAAERATLLEISNQQANAATAAGSKYEEKMLEMQSMILELQKQVAAFAKQKPPAQTRQRHTNEPLDPNGYCWTHGYCVSMAHNSATCNFPAKGNQKDATRANTKGGSTKNKPNE
jgi:hypothetical protein